MRLYANGQPTRLQYPRNRLLFAGTELGSEWADAVDHWPDGFNRVELADGAVHVPGLDQNTYNGGSLQRMNHVMATIPIGLTDNFEVQMRQDARVGLTCWCQTSPVVFGDIPGGAQLELGLMPTFDVSRPNGVSFYMQNAFASDTVGNVFDPAFYDVLPGTGSASGRVADPAIAQQWWIVRCVAGKIQYWFNGRKMCNPVNVPAAYQGRDAIGFHVIHYHSEPGDIIPGLGVPSPYAWSSRIPALDWAPYDIPLTPL